MSTFFTAAGMLAVLALTTVLTGRSLGGLFGIPILRRFNPEGAAASAVAGTGVWVLVSGWCSYAGLAAPTSLVLIAVLVAVLVAGLAWRGRCNWLRPQGRRQAWAVWLATLVTGSALTLLPLGLCGFFNPYNDTLNYCSLAESLQASGIGLSTPPEPARPASDAASLLYECHVQNWRLGAMFLLALVQALLVGSTALEVFPVVMAWGVLLNAGALYCLARWAWRLPRWPALLAPMIALVTVNPLLYSAHYGFLSQVYGTATLTFALALLGRVRPRLGRPWVRGALLALVLASMLSLYSELAPVLLIAVGVHMIWQWVRGWHAGNLCAWLTISAVTFLVFAALANVEMLRGWRALTIQLHATTGTHVDWPALQYWGFALGSMRFYEVRRGRWFLTAAATACLTVGLVRLLRRRLVGLGCSLALLAALAGYFHWFARDPWTGEIGQSWSQFKLCKWAFPLLVSGQVAGLVWLLRRLPRMTVLVPLAGAVLLVLSWHQHVRWAADADAFGWRSLGGDRPFAELRELRRLRGGGSGQVVRVVHDNDGPIWPHGLVKYLLFAEPCIIPERAVPEASEGYVAGQDYVMLGRPPFEDPLEQLPCGLSRLDASRPLVFGLVAADGIKGSCQGARLSVWSPLQGPAMLVLALTSGEGEGEGEDSGFRLSITDAFGQTQSRSGTCGAIQSIRVALPSGVSRLQLTWSGPHQRLRHAKLEPAATPLEP